MSKKRTHYYGNDKTKILKEHLLEGKSISDVCEKYNIKPSMFYTWQRQFFENGHLAFEKNKNSKNSKLEKKISRLEQKLTQKNEVLSELMEEHVALKKSLGEI